MSAVRGSSAPAPAAAEMWFEDFRVGQRFRSAERTITADDVASFTEISGDGARIHADAEYARSLGFSGALAHGPFGIAIVFGLLHGLGIVDGTAIAMRDLDWRFLAPIVAPAAVHMEMVITRCRPHPARNAGVVNRHFRLLAADGATLQEGTSSMLVRARAGGEDPASRAATDFCSPAWAALLAPALEANPAFRDATATFDGAIGLRAGRDEVQLRVYKGRVLETGRSTPLGASFTLAADELTWAELAIAERNDFIARASRGAFSVRGNAYEYLRLNKALVVLWDEVRALAAKEAAR